MSFWENKIKQRIREDFSINVKAKTRLSEAEWQKLYEALDVIFRYYDLPRDLNAKIGISIEIHQRLYKPGFRRGEENEIGGYFSHNENVVAISMEKPGSLVHELVHAVDFNFRNNAQDQRTRKSYIAKNEKAFAQFLKASGISRYDVSDFEKTFCEMASVDDNYLSLPSEILARMGAYSFWQDNEEICARNPFLNFAHKAYAINEDSEFGRSICQFPFHKIEAVRQFVHHAAREEAGLEFAPWHPEVHERPVMNHESGWYEKSRNYVLDIANRYNTAIENLNNAKYCIENIKYYHTDEDIMNMRNALEKARADLAPVEKEYQQCISFFLNEIGDKEFHERFDEIRSDCKLVLLSAYLGDCRNVASLGEEKAKEKTAKRKNIPIKDTE